MQEPDRGVNPTYHPTGRRLAPQCIWWDRKVQLCAILALSLQTAAAGPVEDFYKLEDQMAEAHEAYAEALHALESASGGKPVDKAKLPPDRRPAILKKMDTLAVGSTGEPGGVDAAVGAFMWSWNLDIDLEHLVARFDHLVKHYASNLELDDVLPAIVDAATAAEKPDDWVKTLNRLIAATKRDQTRLGALFTLGRIQLGIKRLTDAKASFAKVLKSGGKSDYADQAKGYIHEIEHLQVGMVAPDFIARKLDGKAISLKSLRGKAVLLNFWAAW